MQKIGVFLIKLIAFTAAVMGIHYYIVLTLFEDLQLYFPIWSIYLFNAVMVACVYSFIAYRASQGSKNVFNLFLSLTVVKMVLIIIFLLPVFMGKTDNVMPDTTNFFLAYFVLLGFEVLSLNYFFKKL